MYVRIVNAVFNSPWAIHRPVLGSIFQVLHSKVLGEDRASAVLPGYDGGGFTGGSREASFRDKQGASFYSARYGIVGKQLVNHSARISAEAAKKADSWEEFHSIVRDEEAKLPAGQIMHVFGSGVVGKHLSSMEESCAGGLSIDRIQAALKAARDDDKVAAVMLHLDSPGGICYGMPETAALVRSVKQTKLVAAFGDSLTASAAFGAVCNADAIYGTVSSDWGSIGVYSAIVDYTAWCEKQGIKVELIKDGTYKGAGFMGTSLTAEQRAKIEEDVMACSRQFKSDVRLGRPDVADETMQGQCFMGPEAKASHLIDAIVNDLEEALSDVAKAL